MINRSIYISLLIQYDDVTEGLPEIPQLPEIPNDDSSDNGGGGAPTADDDFDDLQACGFLLINFYVNFV